MSLSALERQCSSPLTQVAPSYSCWVLGCSAAAAAAVVDATPVTVTSTMITAVKGVADQVTTHQCCLRSVIHRAAVVIAANLARKKLPSSNSVSDRTFYTIFYVHFA